MIRYCVIFVLLFICNYAHTAGLEVIHLQHQPAEDIIPVIRPLVGNDGVVTGSGYKLIIRAPAQRLDEIKKLLLEIDRPLQQLIISVRQGRKLLRETDKQSIAGNVGSGDARLKVGRPTRSGGLTMRYRDGDDMLQAHMNQRNTELNDDISQQVRTISGRPAYISVGQSQPVPQQQTIVQGNRVVRTYNTQYYETGSGFYVTPRLRGDQVSLEISAGRQQPGRYRVESSGLSTTVSGKLGEWIQLGGSNEISNQSGSGLIHNRTSQTADLRDISVKVTLAY